MKRAWTLILVVVLAAIGAFASIGTGVLQGESPESWCLNHLPGQADGWKEEIKVLPPHVECVYVRSHGEGPITEVSREWAFH